MDTNTLVFENGNKGGIRVKPLQYPTKYVINFTGSGTLLYGLNGSTPHKEIHPHVAATVIVDNDSLMMDWDVDADSEIQWQSFG